MGSRIARSHEFNIPKNRARPLVSAPRRMEDPKHLAFIRGLPCLITGSEAGVEAHHLLRLPDPHARGGAMKSDDCWTIPLTKQKHAELHHTNSEIAFLAKHGIYGPAVAALLWMLSGQQENAERAIHEIRAVRPLPATRDAK